MMNLGLGIVVQKDSNKKKLLLTCESLSLVVFVSCGFQVCGKETDQTGIQA